MSDVVSIRIGTKELAKLSSYSFDADFGQASDSFDAQIETTNAKLADEIAIGEELVMSVNGVVQFTGFIDQVNDSDSSSGYVVTVSGRDKIARLTAARLDENAVKIVKEDTLESAIKKAVEPFSFTSFEIDDEAHRNLIAGQKVGYVNNAKTAKGKGKRLDKKIDHDTKPTKGEGVYDFIDRLAKNFGLTVWISADGKTLFISTPTFDQAPLYDVTSRFAPNAGNNNAKSKSRNISWINQPSVIIGQAEKMPSSTGNSSKARVLAVNEITGYLHEGTKLTTLTPLAQSIVSAKKNQGCLVLPKRDEIGSALAGISYRNSGASDRPLYFEDTISKTTEQLAFAVQRKLAELQSKFWQYTVTVPGHSRNGAIWNVNTCVTLVDEAREINGIYWIKKRTFSNSRGSGQQTTLTIIPKFCMEI